MTIESIMKFNLRIDYYNYGIADAKAGILDSSYFNRTEDARLSYLAGWSSVPVEKRANGHNIQVAYI